MTLYGLCLYPILTSITFWFKIIPYFLALNSLLYYFSGVLALVTTFKTLSWTNGIFENLKIYPRGYAEECLTLFIIIIILIMERAPYICLKRKIEEIQLPNAQAELLLQGVKNPKA